MDFFEVVILSFAVQAVFIGFIFIFNRKGDRVAKIIWFIFLFLLSYNLFNSVLYWSCENPKLIKKLSAFYFLPIALVGPLFFLFVKRRITQRKLKLNEVLLHLIPAAIVLISCLGIFLIPAELKEALTKDGIRAQHKSIINPYFLVGFILSSLFFYGLAAYRIYRKYTYKGFEITFWIKTITLVFLGFCTLRTLYFIMVVFNGYKAEYYYTLITGLTLFLGFVTYLGYIHPELFNGRVLKALGSPVKYKNAGFSAKLSIHYKQKLLDGMHKDKLYLNNDLRLNDLSEYLGIARHHTSQLVNEHFQMGFFDLINKFRVEEVVRLLLNNTENLSTIEIAYRSGFNNKVSFYRAFKKFKGVTPTHYLSKHQAST
ncbi:helix-turn-helix domain-containing protein [Flavobacteriaceae bacterium 3-367]|uniref:AraC family transcriptional regulator n=1 Tax=Eudoraea algarum TaxID=3417568 RepID=UPI00328C752D